LLLFKIKDVNKIIKIQITNNQIVIIILFKIINITMHKKTVELSTVFKMFFYYLLGMFFKISNKNFQNFCVDEILALSSGE